MTEQDLSKRGPEADPGEAASVADRALEDRIEKVKGRMRSSIFLAGMGAGTAATGLGLLLPLTPVGIVSSIGGFAVLGIGAIRYARNEKKLDKLLINQAVLRRAPMSK